MTVVEILYTIFIAACVIAAVVGVVTLITWSVMFLKDKLDDRERALKRRKEAEANSKRPEGCWYEESIIHGDHPSSAPLGRVTLQFCSSDLAEMKHQPFYLEMMKFLGDLQSKRKCQCYSKPGYLVEKDLTVEDNLVYFFADSRTPLLGPKLEECEEDAMNYWK